MTLNQLVTNSLFELMDFPRSLIRDADDFFSKDRSNLPPYNITEYPNSNTFRIDIGVPGFKKEDLNVSLEENTLSISAKTKQVDNEERPKLVLRRLVRHEFKHEFKLDFYIGKAIQISSVKLEDGILSIDLLKIVPEETKPKMIPIEDVSSSLSSSQSLPLQSTSKEPVKN